MKKNTGKNTSANYGNILSMFSSASKNKIENHTKKESEIKENKEKQRKSPKKGKIDKIKKSEEV